VHGLFADGSCCSKAIARLPQNGVHCTSVQNPLTSLHEASEAAQWAIVAQPGPTVLGRPLLLRDDRDGRGSGSKVTLVYVGARAPDAGEDYIALAKNYRPPAAVFSDDWVRDQLSEEAFLHDFAGDLPPEEARALRCREMPA
jgi:hypothetical protein